MNSRNITRSIAASLKAATLGALILAAGSALAQDPGVVSQASNGNDRVPTESDFDFAGIDLRTAVWLDRDRDEVYQRGEEQGVGFQTNQDAYAVVYRIDAEGYVRILWPRSRMDDGFVFGGHEYLLPVSGSRALRVSNREGEGFVQAIVSKYPFDLRDLEIDFHHEPTVDSYDFQVAGDPYLAMNEVNFAVTGLEDSEEFVVTDHTGYYVHRQVDHPRYLCNQCHFEDDTVYHPYRDECTLTIEYDYGWSNEWYGRYGYYPVYVNPVYVYVDPWTYRPWINWWYYPSYVCAPSWGWGWNWGWGSCYTWYYSPYYRGDCYTYVDAGYTRYRPLNKYPGPDHRVKTREYGRVSPMMKGDQPDSRTKQAMRDRTVIADRKRGTDVDRGRLVRGQDPMTRQRQDLSGGSRVRGNPGLRIRDGGSTSASTRSKSEGMRHRAAGADGRSRLTDERTRTPDRVIRGGSSGSIGSRSRISGSETKPGTTVRSRGGSGSGNIKTVEPRKKGTRIWSSRSGSGTSDRKSRSSQVRPGSSSRKSEPSSRSRSRTVKPSGRSSTKRDSGAAVKSRSGGSSSKRNSSSTVKSRPRSNSKSSSSSSGGGRSSSVKSRSSGSSKSSGTRSGGGSRSSGGSRSGGSSSSKSRSGGRR